MDEKINSQKNSQISVIILAGGKGTRLRELDSTRPKPMVEIYGKPFLYWQISYYIKQGFQKFILSTQHLAEQIENYPWTTFFPKAQFDFFREAEPLGTGGAVMAVFEHFKFLEFAWVVNGDTFLPDELPRLEPIKTEIIYSVLEKNEVFDAKPNLVVENEFIIGESQESGRYFDAGAVFLNRNAVERYKGKPKCSFHELAAPSMKINQVGYRILSGTCYDIGTPARFKRFEEYLSSSGMKENIK